MHLADVGPVALHLRRDWAAMHQTRLQQMHDYGCNKVVVHRISCTTDDAIASDRRKDRLQTLKTVLFNWGFAEYT